jgi:hypothetical protein
MRNRIIRNTLLAFSLLTLLTFQSSFGQENENAKSKFGLGASLFNLTEHIDEQANSIYVTINIGTKFRLEPKFGFIIHDGFEQYLIEMGAFIRKPISKFNFLYGIRLGYSSIETTMIAPTIGGEYYIIKNFSIGSEVQLQGLINSRNFAVLTNSSVIVRFYF